MKNKSIEELIAEYDERIAEARERINKLERKKQRTTDADKRILLEKKLWMYYDILNEQTEARNKLKDYNSASRSNSAENKDKKE